MKALAQLDHLNLDPDVRTQVQMLLEQSQKEVHSQALKIQALTMELAYLRRIRFRILGSRILGSGLDSQLTYLDLSISA